MDDIINLKKIYLIIADLLKANSKVSELILIYIKLSIIYLDDNDIQSARQCLILSQNLNI